MGHIKVYTNFEFDKRILKLYFDPNQNFWKFRERTIEELEIELMEKTEKYNNCMIDEFLIKSVISECEGHLKSWMNYGWLYINEF